MLLGKVGDNVFPIGRGISLKAPQNGILELSIHDHVNCLLDNDGILDVKVEEGLNRKGILKELILYQLGTLTPAERQRLLLIVKDIAACEVVVKNPFSSPACIQVLTGLFGLVLSPPGVVE